MRTLLFFAVLAITLLISIPWFTNRCFSQNSAQSTNQDEAIPNPQPQTTFTEGAEVITTFMETPLDVPVTRNQAVQITSALLGIDPPESCPARLGLATDNTVPCMKVVDRPAWEITYENLAVALPGMEGSKPEFSTLICLLDARTGALLKISTLPPALGYEPGELEYMMPKLNESFTAIEAAGLPEAAVMPLIPLLGEIEKKEKNTVKTAKQLTVFLGLYTKPFSKIADSPHWLVQTGGLQMPYGEFTTTNACFWIDAKSGDFHGKRFVSY